MRRRLFVLSLAAFDLLTLAAGWVIASVVVFDTAAVWRAPGRPGESIMPLLGLMVLGAVVGTYVSRRMWGSGVPRPTYGRALAIVGGTVVFTALGIVFFRIYWSRPFFLVASLVWAFGTLAHRAVRRRRPWTETMIVISGEKSLADDLRTSPHANVQHVYDPGGEPPSEQPMPGTTVVVDLRSILSEQMAQFVSSCNIAGYRIRALIDVYEEHTGRLALIHLAEGWEISEPLSRSSGYAPFKRSGDFLLALVTAPLWLPLGALIWVAVRLDSRGPAIFKQRRTGYRGSAFTLYKFRTMYDETRDEGPRFAHPEDDRVTRVGKVLRRFRVDEIPQMWNVLKGDLSLVGPRPEQQEFVARFNESIPFYGYRHLVRPGLTGWAQVSYGYADDEADTIEKLTYDLYYVKHMSPWFDARVIGQSIWTVVSGFGAQ